MNAQEYLATASERDASLKAYAEMARLPDDEARASRMEALSAPVKSRVEILFSINACPSCGTSRTAADAFCERCGDSQDSYFDVL